MTPNKIYHGNALTLMQEWPDKSVNCIVTSPPYWGLRDYGHSDQLGQEATPEEFVANLVAVLREAKRVLRNDGTLWLNLGDSYWGGKGAHGSSKARNTAAERGYYQSGGTPLTDTRPQDGKHESIKPKDLVGIPWMVAFALRADGWYLRQDIIWNKPNPMPESVTDRCTKAHEYIFLLSKSNKYYYDAESIKTPIADASVQRLLQSIDNQKRTERVPGKTNGAMKAVGPRIGGNKYGDDQSEQSRTKSGNVWTGRQGTGIDNTAAINGNGVKGHSGNFSADGQLIGNGMANKKSVWTITTKPYKEAHFATFPPDLIRPCILAGCPVGGIVLDPFGGSGTTAQVAIEAGRQWVLCELNPKYIEIASRRLASIQTKILL